MIILSSQWMLANVIPYRSKNISVDPKVLDSGCYGNYNKDLMGFIFFADTFNTP
jgi:hypothetical protein